jgi:uncharacterized HAD superfamily protein
MKHAGKFKKIGLDMDGCLANFNKGACKWLFEKEGIVTTSSSLMNYGPEVDKLMHHPRHAELLLSLEAYPDAIETVKKWQSEGKQLVVITHRGADPHDDDDFRAGLHKATVGWLAKFGLDIPVVMAKDKFQYAQQNGVDLLVEDRAKTVEVFAQGAIPSLFFVHSYNERPSSHDQIAQVSDWKEAQWLVQQLEAGKSVDTKVSLWK